MTNFSSCPICGACDWWDKKLPSNIYHENPVHQRSCKNCMATSNDRFRLCYLDEAHTDLYMINFCLYDIDNNRGFEIKNFLTEDYSSIEKHLDMSSPPIIETGSIKWNYASRLLLWNKLKTLLIFS